MQDAMGRYSYSDNSAMAPQSIKVDFTSRTIAGEEYVTAAQFREGMSSAAKQGAKQGERQVYASLRNSRSRRSKLGM
jgi:hypothetical protein